MSQQLYETKKSGFPYWKPVAIFDYLVKINFKIYVHHEQSSQQMLKFVLNPLDGVDGVIQK
jgi:hypothetical protein